jgi:hypothetical protein
MYIFDSPTITITGEDKDILIKTHEKTKEQLSNRYANNDYGTLGMLICCMFFVFLSAKQKCQCQILNLLNLI